MTQPLYVLIVEDNPDSAASMALLLQTCGCKTAVAPDGPTALRLAGQDAPDVVLVDIGLPVMDGWQLAGHLRRQQTAKPPLLIATTGYGSEADFRRSEEAGIDLHLVKPVDAGELLSVLHRFQRVVAPPLDPQAPAQALP
jgi:CheY-like chemotaxis protein